MIKHLVAISALSLLANSSFAQAESDQRPGQAAVLAQNPDMSDLIRRPEVIAALGLTQADVLQKNIVLTQMRVGLYYFRKGQLDAAEKLFSSAQETIDTIYSNNKAAQDARSTFVPEKTKDFKGDPYERAMVGYYLGVIDLMRGQYDNARASFKYALLQDGMSASETYQSDMSLMQYLIGWTHWCEGSVNQAKEEFDNAKLLSPGIKPPEKGQYSLYLAETGTAPIKKASGANDEILSYLPGDAPIAVQIALKGATESSPQLLMPMEDLYFQASTRGGAAVDVIRAGKASFKQKASDVAGVTKSVANVAEGAAVATGLSGDKKNASILLAFSIAAKVVSKVSSTYSDVAQTKADDRAWNNLPGYLSFATAAEPDLNFGYYDKIGQYKYSVTPISGGAKKCSIRYASLSAERNTQTGWPTIGAYKGPQTEESISDEGADILNSFRKKRDATTAR